MDEPRATFIVPGSQQTLVFERNEAGRLSAIRGGGRCYLRIGPESDHVYDGDFVRVSSVELPSGVLRSVRSGRRSWCESFTWGAEGLLEDVDGVHIGYDAERRVVSCSGPAGEWRYAYSGPYLSVVDSPRGLRRIVRADDGRPVAWRDDTRSVHIDYDASGRRRAERAAPRRERWHRDPAGRLWCATDPNGRVLRTYLWDGFHCLACIDGEVGQPLSAVYSLDPTGTPVRVTTRDGQRRIPRDAFGEALLAEQAVPGLFGGAVGADGLVHLPERRLDPLTGSFDSRDPFHGEAADPRRAAGYTGPLPAELPASGPYTVCRNNPISLADPTGAISDFWWLIPSALTWSIQNTIGSLLGMWLNLEFSPLGMIVSALAGANPFDLEWLSAKGFDSFGLRADGWLSRIQPVAWTYQFLVNEEKAEFVALEDARLFAPSDAFRPELYGSVLRCVPASGNPFLLRGQRTPPNGARLPDWSRAGGDAEPAIPGSLVPVFPRGGLHFGNVRRGQHAGAAEIVELAPSGAVSSGTLGTRAQLEAPGTGLGLTPNALVLLTGTSGIQIARVLGAQDEGGRTLIRVDSTLAGFTPPIRLEGLSALVGTESLSPVAGQSTFLSAIGSSNDYRPGLSVLRIQRGGAPVGFGKVQGLEARLTLDAALPASLGSSLRVRPAAATGNFNATLTADARVLRITGGSVPGPGTGIVIGAAAAAIACIVLEIPSGGDVRVDRDLTPLGGDGAAVPWQILAPLPAVGVRSAAVEAAAQLTYVPERPGAAPATGFVWIEGGGIAARRITGLAHDALVLDTPLPDTAAPYDVDRFTLQAPDVSGLGSTSSQVLALNAPPPADARAFHLIELTGAALGAGAVLLGAAALTGDTASANITPSAAPAGLVPGQLVVLRSGPTLEAAAIARLRLTVGIAPTTRSLPLSASGLSAVLLAANGPAFAGDRRADRTLRLQPQVGTTVTDLPRFGVGELLLVTWTAPSSGERLFRVQFVSGGLVTGADDEDIIPATVTALSVQRLTLQDPASGSSRLGIGGEVIAPGQLRFDVWRADAFDLAPAERLGIVDGENVFALSIASGNQNLDVVFTAAPALAGPIDITAAPVLVAAGATGSGFSTRFTLDGASVAFSDSPLPTPGSNLVLALAYLETTRRGPGQLQTGSVRVPEDHENAGRELDRRQSLTDHELAHTHQSARLGPWLFSYFPLFLLEAISDLGLGSGLPEFSAYVPATLENDAIIIPAAAGVSFAAEDTVQVAQNGRAASIELGARDGDRYAITPRNRQNISSFGPGPVQVRREETGGVEVAEWTVNIMQFLTVGGLMNQITVAGWGGFTWVIRKFVQWIRTLAHSSKPAQLAADHVTLSVPGALPEGVAPNIQLAIQAGDNTFVRSVQSVTGANIVLAAPVPADGTVQISVYSPTSALFSDPHRYFPARVPDANLPASLEVLPSGSATLSLAVNDRVHIRRSDGTTFNTVVTAIGAAGAVEVEEATLVHPGEVGEFFIAKIGEDDPVGSTDQFLLNQMHLGWMQYLHDPWGQIVYRAQPTSTVGQIFARSARYLFGTQSWSILPAFGYFWWDNAFKRSNPHRSRMEQEASRRSGDTYCPLGTLHGEFSVVGDVARYWLTVSGGTRNDDPPDEMILAGRQDAPGVQLQQYALVTPAGGAAPAGTAVTEAFSQIDGALALAGIGPRGFIPSSPSLERSLGIYAAFTRPSAAGTPHGIGAQTLTGIGDSIDAQADGAATINFPRAIADVAVSLGGLPVAEAATFDVIPYQRALLDVEPKNGRIYRATLSEPGAIASLENDDTELVIRGIAPPAAPADTDRAEISRYYHYDPAARAFTSSGLGPLHLPTDIDIAVRRFALRLTNTLSLRASVDLTAAPITNVRPADRAFLLVPARIAPVPITTVVSGTPALSPRITPAASVPSAVQAFVRDGAVLDVIFPADQPPEAPATLTLSVSVGPDAATAVAVTSQVIVDPHFTLDAASFQVAVGATLTLRASDGTNIALVNPLAGIVTSANGAEIELQVDAAAAPGPHVVLVRDTAQAERQARRTITIV